MSIRARRKTTASLAAWRYFVAILLVLTTGMATAADRDRLEAFLKVTGFDVALESIRLSASSAPEILGVDPGDFGSQWTRLTEQVFDTEVMHDMALEILRETLTNPLLNHAAGFYATELGQRLVVAENAAHLDEDQESAQTEGTALIAEMVAEGSPRLALIKRMNGAIDATGTSVRAVQEIQIRFLLAASAAGVVDLRIDPNEMIALIQSQEGELRRSIQKSAMAGSAYTYRTFSDADLEAYAEALEHPDMKRVYELMNAVQYEVMANRFEVLAVRMADLRAGQDI